MYGQRGWEIITSVLESLRLGYGELSSDEKRALKTVANGSANDGDNIQAVRHVLALPRKITWYLELTQSQECAIELATEIDFQKLPLDPPDETSAAWQHGPENAACAINGMVGGELVTPEEVARLEAECRGADATDPATLLSVDVAPETVVAMLHQKGVATHMHRHVALGHTDNPPLDRKQMLLLDDRLDTKRLMLCVSTPGGADRYVAFQKIGAMRTEAMEIDGVEIEPMEKEGQWWVQEGITAPRVISPSDFLQEQRANDFTAIWPAQRLVRAVVPATQAPPLRSLPTSP